MGAPDHYIAKLSDFVRTRMNYSQLRMDMGQWEAKPFHPAKTTTFLSIFCARRAVAGRALWRGAGSGLMLAYAGRFDPPDSDRCIRHGTVTLMPYAAADSN